MLKAQNVLKEIKAKSDPKRAETYRWFFKTEKGEYGEGDVFAGITVPVCRQIAKAHQSIPLAEVSKLLKNKIHEARLVALVILTTKYNKALPKDKKEMVDFYLNHTKHINNWDLVDISAHKILGDWLLDKKSERKILLKLANSGDLWEERISVVATFMFIRDSDFDWSLRLAEKFLKHKHDPATTPVGGASLIHKVTGWMLREVGKKDVKVLKNFLDKHAEQMPRTMLRYAIEKFPEIERKKYLKKK